MKQIGLGLMGLGNIGIGTWKTLEMNGETIKKNRRQIGRASCRERV